MSIAGWQHSRSCATVTRWDGVVMDLLDRMLGHDHWATAQLLERCGALTDEQLDQEFDIGHHSLRETLDHMIYVIDFWTGLMSGRPVAHDRTTQQYDRSLDSLIERHERFQPAFASFARQATDEQRLDETFIDHYDVRQSIGATILQLLNHNAQHRSEIRHILERLGVTGLWDYDPQEWEHVTGHIQRR
jgi:uncharacterized damage-inducible protein DinB